MTNKRKKRSRRVSPRKAPQLQDPLEVGKIYDQLDNIMAEMNDRKKTNTPTEGTHGGTERQ